MDALRSFRLSDLRGAVRLAADATTGVTGIVEAMHATIASVSPPFGRPPKQRARGISGLVYRAVQTVAGQIGQGFDGVLGAFSPGLAASSTSIEREAVIAALNGVLGDHLEASGNPLAIQMAFRRDGVALALDRESLAAAVPDASQRLLIVVHGLCMNDLQWNWKGVDRGAQLAEEFGYSRVALHYNSGRHVSLNGEDFATQLQALVDAWPVKLREIRILAHSMGGLVTRAACAAAERDGLSWRRQLRAIFFLGTPHLGAPLERHGHRLQSALGFSAYVAPLATLGKLRSAGITDLRHGSVCVEDWQHGDRFADSDRPPQHLPLPKRVRCYAVAATTSQAAADVSKLRSDALVPVASALGLHADPQQRLAFGESQRWIGYGLNHWDLLADASVHKQLRSWLAPTRNEDNQAT